MMLGLNCLGLIGQYYVMDNPSTLHEPLKDRFASSMSDDTFAYNFNLLYSVYSLPNIVIPIVFGALITRWGLKSVYVLLVACVFIGQVVVVAGVRMNSMSLMLLGRVIFGLGGESINVAGSTMLTTWFKGKEVAFALAFNLSVARAGSVLNDVISPAIDNAFGLDAAFNFGLAFLTISCLGNLFMVHVHHTSKIDSRSESDTTPEMSDIFRFAPVFWILNIVVVLLYCMVLPFNNIASAFYIETFFSQDDPAVARQTAGYVMSVMFITSALMSPFCGAFLDKYGHRLDATCLSALIGMLTHTFMTVINPYSSSFFLGLTYTIFGAAVWPMIPSTVDESQVGPAYGVTTAMQNFGLFAVPLIVGFLRARFETYLAVSHFLGSIGVVAFFMAFYLRMRDRSTGGYLNCPVALGIKKEDPLFADVTDAGSDLETDHSDAERIPLKGLVGGARRYGKHEEI